MPQWHMEKARSKNKTHRRQCKFRHLKKITSKGALLVICLCLRPRAPTHTNPPLPPLHTVYVYTGILILIHTDKGGEGEILNREKVRGATVYKDASKIPI